jgi:cytochrome d ubiquinol oxidase subunit I
MEISTIGLAQAQFSLNLGFFNLFAALSTVLAWVVFWFRARSWRETGAGWLSAYRFWVRIFALCYFLTLGLLVPVLIQVGTLWPSLLERIGNVVGPLVAFGLVSLFLFKSIFMGILLYGQRRVSERIHVFSAFGAAAGMSVTAFWALALWSWLQAPDGATLIDGRFQVYHWPDVILNPMLAPQVLLFLAFGLLATGWMMVGLPAWLCRKRPLEEGDRHAFRTGLAIVLVALVACWFALDFSVRSLARQQPVLAAAMAGHMQTGSPPDMVVLGWPDLEDRSVGQTWVIKGAQGRWLGKNAEHAYIGLNASEQNPPAVNSLFVLTRVIVFLLIGLTLLAFGCWFLAVRKGADPTGMPGWLVRLLSLCTFSGWVACMLVFLWTEVGRWPYLVQGVILAADVVLQADVITLATGLVGWVLLHTILVGGMVRMFFHSARYGVISVRKADARGRT